MEKNEEVFLGTGPRDPFYPGPIRRGIWQPFFLERGIQWMKRNSIRDYLAADRKGRNPDRFIPVRFILDYQLDRIGNYWLIIVRLEVYFFLNAFNLILDIWKFNLVNEGWEIYIFGKKKEYSLMWNILSWNEIRL